MYQIKVLRAQDGWERIITSEYIDAAHTLFQDVVMEPQRHAGWNKPVLAAKLERLSRYRPAVAVEVLKYWEVK